MKTHAIITLLIVLCCTAGTAGAARTHSALPTGLTHREAEVMTVDVARFPSLDVAVSMLPPGRSATFIITGETAVNGSVTISDTMGIRLEKSGLLRLAQGARLVINGTLESSPQRIFTGTGRVIIGPLVKEIYPQWWGARGNGSDVDTDSINQAAAALSRTGGCLTFPPGTYRVDGQLKLYGNTRITGRGATILGDFSGRALLTAEGSAAKELMVTADTAAGATSLSLESTSGIAPGDLVLIQDNRNATRYAREFLTIAAVSPHAVTLVKPVTHAYKTSYHASCIKISGLENIEIDAITLAGSSDSDLAYLLFLNNVNHVRVHDVSIRGHRHPSAPNLLISLFVRQCNDVTIESVKITGIGEPHLDMGDSISLFACGHGVVKNCLINQCAFGIGAWLGTGYLITGNRVTGYHTSGRGIKLAGSYRSEITNNHVQATDSGLKIEDSGSSTIRNNTLVDCGIATYSIGINISNQYSSAEGDYSQFQVTGNTIRNQKGVGIYLDSNVSDSSIVGNTVDQTSDRGIVVTGVRNRISGNSVFDTAGTAVVFNPNGTLVTDNVIRSARPGVKSFRITTPDHPENATFTGNSATENPWDTAINPAILGVYRNNRIVGTPSTREDH